MPIALPSFSTTASITGSTLISQADNQLNIFMTDVKNYMTNSYLTIESGLSTLTAQQVLLASQYANDSQDSATLASQYATSANTSKNDAVSAKTLAEGFANSANASANTATTKAYEASIRAIEAAQYATDTETNALAVASHLSNTTNPHNVTKSQVGLGNVTNTSDTAKPVIGFTLDNTTVPTRGQCRWNIAEDTLDLGQTNSVLQLGQELQVPVINTSGSTIPNGKVVEFTGTIGNSGKLTVGLAHANTGEAKKLVGITTHDITNNSIGMVTAFGKVRGINTTGSTVGETWQDGDILYPKPNDAGNLTNIEPLDTELKVPIAVVVHAHTAGTLFVRLTPIDENHAKADLLTKASINQLVALAEAVGLSPSQIENILNA